MGIKKFFQYGLLVLLIVSSFLFYNEYFTEDIKKIENNQSQDVLEKNNETNINDGANVNNENKNIIENLKYVSEDLLGNIYTVTAQSATLKEDKLNEVQLFKVNAEIARENQEIIYIYSETANYNKVNNNTVFKKKVNVKYGNQIIDSKILKLDFKEKLIEILDNVNYLNENTKIKADKVEIDLLDKKLKISMNNQEDKVNIISKY